MSREQSICDIPFEWSGNCITITVQTILKWKREANPQSNVILEVTTSQITFESRCNSTFVYHLGNAMPFRSIC